MAVLAVLVVTVAVWVARPLDREAFCTKAVAIHNQGTYAGFPAYWPLVYLAGKALSPDDALRIRAAVKEAQSTRSKRPIYYNTGPVGEELIRLCPDHEVFSVIATE